MVERHGKFVEVKPMTQVHQETLILDIDDRKIISVHVHEPRGKYVQMWKQIRDMYGHNFMCMILEIITAPNKKKSVSLKTTTHNLIYFNIQDINNDFNEIKRLMYE
ncbi:MAG: hypothetical protein ACOC2U_03260 [bacterium]